MTLEWDDVAGAMNAREPARMPGRKISGWSIDSRTLAPGELFFALRGPQHDGHAYVDAAFEKGAAGAVVEEACESGPVLVVHDTLAALQRLAVWARGKWAGKVVGITG